MQKIRKSKFRYNFETMLVAVDIGKDKNYVRFRDTQGNDSRAYNFSNSRSGFEKFLDLISWHKSQYNAKNVVVGFESTGCYGIPLAHFLDKQNITTYLVNPVHTKRLKEVQDNSPNKTDQKDPRVIADIMQIGGTLSIIIPKGSSATLRNLVHARERALDMRTMLHNQLHDLVFQIFPEFNHHIKNLLGKTSLYILEHYTSPDKLAQLPDDQFGLIIKKISRGKISTAKAIALLEDARNHVGITEGTDAINIEICQMVKHINYLQQNIFEVESKIVDIVKSLPLSRPLLSIKGIGAITAATIIGETGAFEKFEHAREFEKLAGLNLFEISSGNHKGQKRISKRGRTLLRKALFFAALNAVKKQGHYYQQYQNYLMRGMPKNKALIAITRKLVRVIFALVRDNSLYNPEYELKQISQKAA